jgi:hypothetical protein
MSRYNTYTLPLGPVDITADAGDPDVRKVISSTVTGITTSSLTDVLLYSTLVPAGTYIANEVLDIRTLGTKSATNNTCTLRFWYGTTASLSGATQLAQCLYTSTSRSLPLHRRLGIRSATNSTIAFDTTRSATTDLAFGGSELNGRNGESPGGIDLVSVNWQNDVWILVSGDVDNASDVLQVRYFKINN